MRAAVLRNGRMIERDDVTEPVPGPGQVLVGVKACGICGSDLHFAKYGADVLVLNNQIDGFGGSGGMQIDLNHDIFMGHEFSAEVLEAGPDTDARLLARSSRLYRCWCRRRALNRLCTPTRQSAVTPNGCCCRRRS
jgi:threonine dehydrogenase-like Zn-dependent dehydrogenase